MRISLERRLALSGVSLVLAATGLAALLTRWMESPVAAFVATALVIIPVALIVLRYALQPMQKALQAVSHPQACGSPSFFFRSAFTCCGLALPPVFFITCPTKKPNRAVLPARY